MNRIVCFHLFNDYSGSPKVLCQVLDGLLEKGWHIHLVTSRGGALSALEGRKNLIISYYPYRFSPHAAATLFKYAVVQAYTFLLALRCLFRKNTVFYINTLLPAGPALAGRLTGKRVVYHYHENAFAKNGFYKLLCRVMQQLSSRIICVSGHQRSFLDRKEKTVVIPNALPPSFCDRFSHVQSKTAVHRNVLMLSSLKGYKGTLDFIRLAEQMPRHQFTLVINDEQEAIDAFLSAHAVQAPENLNIRPRQQDVAPFYEQASLVLNLSDKKLFIETFGLTALEAMTAAVPVIVPTVGGIAEMVEDGVNGYKMDVQDLDAIREKIEVLLSDPELYEQLSANAKKTASRYNAAHMISQIETILK